MTTARRCRTRPPTRPRGCGSSGAAHVGLKEPQNNSRTLDAGVRPLPVKAQSQARDRHRLRSDRVTEGKLWSPKVTLPWWQWG